MAKGYSFLTKSAKLKHFVKAGEIIVGYSFLTKSAKLKLELLAIAIVLGYSFLTKSAKLKHLARKSPSYQL